MSTLRTFAISTLVLALSVVLAVAPSATAHKTNTQGDYVSSIDEIAGGEFPMTVTVKQGDDRLYVRNKGEGTLIIYGYKDDPYVRIDERGVFVNKNSEAYYSNQDRFSAIGPPKNLQTEYANWKLVHKRPLSYEFHDHRIHWMLESPPKQINTRSDKDQLVFDWEVPFKYEDTKGNIKGKLYYVGGKPFPYALLAAGGGALLVLLIIVVKVRKRKTTPGD